MSLASKFVWSSVILMIVTFAVTAWVGLIDGYVLGGFFLLMIFFTSGYFYLYASHKKATDIANKPSGKGSFDNCWKNMNAALKRIPSGVPLSWSEGVSRTSTIKHIPDNNNKTHPFRAMIGHSVTGSEVLVIYDVDNDDIAEFNSSPSEERIREPFKDFDPYNTLRRNEMGANGMFNSKRNKKVPKGAFNLQFGGDGDSDVEEPTPTMMDNAKQFGGFNNND